MAKIDAKINDQINKFLHSRGPSNLMSTLPDKLNVCYQKSSRRLPKPISSFVRGNPSLMQNPFGDLSHWKSLPAEEQVDDRERMHSMMFPVKIKHARHSNLTPTNLY
jgi:hypothetical protein